METLTRPGEHAPTNPPAVTFSSVMGICGLGRHVAAAAEPACCKPRASTRAQDVPGRLLVCSPNGFELTLPRHVWLREAIRSTTAVVD
jgi:hypothetical protein